VTSCLIDKSALVRLPAGADAGEWASRIERGLVRITRVTRLEVGFSARNAADIRTGLRRPPVSAMPVEHLTPAIEDRAVEVLALLADRGQHRAIDPQIDRRCRHRTRGPDGPAPGQDFEIIADITGQTLERLIVS